MRTQAVCGNSGVHQRFLLCVKAQRCPGRFVELLDQINQLCLRSWSWPWKQEESIPGF